MKHADRIALPPGSGGGPGLAGQRGGRRAAGADRPGVGVGYARRSQALQSCRQQILGAVLVQLGEAGLGAGDAVSVDVQLSQAVAHTLERGAGLEGAGAREQQREPAGAEMADHVALADRPPGGGTHQLHQTRLVDSRAEGQALDVEYAEAELAVAPAGGRRAALELGPEALRPE